jgi:alkylation response protein AidB-like acyl-CoA dehydrogenase
MARPVHGSADMTDPIALAEALSRELAATAVERDRRGGTALTERNRLRASGLLALSVPTRLGGGGADWATVQRAVRTIARADGSLGHLFGFQHLLLATVRLFGTPGQFNTLAQSTVERRLFWGNALNPLDTRASIERRARALVLKGEKSFCSGARDADVLVVSALDAQTGKLVVAALPAGRDGIAVHDDWDNMGQRQTDSGTVTFRDVEVREDEILSEPGPLGSPFASLRPLLAQLTLTNVYLGIAEGAFEAGRALTRERTRAWFASGVERVVDDPFVLGGLGELYAELESARHVTEAAARRFDDAWAQDEALTTESRGEVAIALAAAKVVTTRVSLDVTSRIFDASGARATTARLGLDRFWRNVRTHTLHDPVDYKRRDIGRWLLTGSWPAPSFYS